MSFDVHDTPSEGRASTVRVHWHQKTFSEESDDVFLDVTCAKNYKYAHIMVSSV